MRIDYDLPEGSGDAIIDGETAAATLFIVFEALRNAARHASATLVRLSASMTDSSIGITVSDDGTGFDPERVALGHGLRHMEERATGAGGTFELRSQPGETVITARIPLRSSGLRASARDPSP
jgi:signal transduction histidine kinase